MQSEYIRNYDNYTFYSYRENFHRAIDIKTHTNYTGIHRNMCKKIYILNIIQS